MAKKPKTSPHQLELQELKEKYNRALADYHNLEKRTRDRGQQYIRIANSALIGKLLAVTGDLERAGKHLSDKGLDMVINQLNQVLQEEGLEEIKAQGQKFNPLEMECVDTVAGSKNTVTKVIQKGYKIADTVVRPTKVEVGNGQKQKN